MTALIRFRAMKKLAEARSGWFAAACIALAAACSSAPPAQLGVVRGVAVDTDGNALPGITVSLQAPDGKLIQTVTTGQDGSYNFPAVPVGQYRVLSTFAGYTTTAPLDATVTPSGLAYLPKLVLASPQ
jgi:hypothetical protein